MSEMGPIERELWGFRGRRHLVTWVWQNPLEGGLSYKAFRVLIGGKQRLGVDSLFDAPELIPDLLSEAIEAAHELGL